MSQPDSLRAGDNPVADSSHGTYDVSGVVFSCRGKAPSIFRFLNDNRSMNHR